MADGADDTTLLDVADPRWQTLLSTHHGAHIFHHPAWTGLLSECYGYRSFVVGVPGSANSIRAGLPMQEVGGGLLGRRWISLPFTDHCTPLHDGTAALDCLTRGLVSRSRERGAPDMELRCGLPAHPSILSHSRHVLHTLPLSSDPAAVAAGFHPSHRRNIRSAQHRGVRIERGTRPDHLKAFYRLHLQTRRRQGVPIQPWKFFEALGRTMLEPGMGFVMLAHHQEECVAGAVFLHLRGTLTYKYSASSLKGQPLRPNDLLIATAIRWGCEHGCRVFDFGKTDLANAGLRAFKSAWGSAEVPLTYSFLSSRPEGPGRDRLLPLLQAVIRHSPAFVCRAAGQLLYKHFGC